MESSALYGTDDESASGCLNNVAGDYGRFIDVQDALDLNEQPVQEAEVSAGDAGNRGNGLAIGEVGVVEAKAELAPVGGKDERELIALQGSVMVGESNTAVELGIPGHAFLYSGHADE